MTKDYPLHPGQTLAEPYYCTVPLDEYESLMLENREMKRRIKELEEGK